MWFYQEKEFTLEDYPDIFGFVYLIEHIPTKKKYIGKKLLTKAAYKTVKGKRKKIRKESDWLDYYGSSPALQADVEKFGKDQFKRTILVLCKSRGECSYWESKKIFESDAILREDFYNAWVSCKIQKSHVKNLWLEGAL